MPADLPVSPLAPTEIVAPPPVAGVRLAGIAAGLKKTAGAKDLMLAELAEGTAVAGVTTRSRCPSAPVEWCRTVLPRGRARAVVVNAGNANAFTGAAGRETVEATAAAAARAVGCAAEDVLLASTGVIGEPLAPDAIAGRLARAAGALSPDGWRDAAAAIGTTDTFPKLAAATATIDGVPVTVAGIAKGSGMIAPDMATMLGFVFTDAAIAAPALDRMLRGAVNRSFNAITVDGDTSTSDTVILAATGRAAHAPVTGPGDRRAGAFRRALDAVCGGLARQIVADGEGASKFVTLRISGATSAAAARRIGLAVGNSPLVKTAIAGEDANWGRIVMAVGKAGERADRDRLAIAIGGVPVAAGGRRVAGYDEGPVAEHMRGRSIDIAIDLGIGRGRATVWTCDLTHGYISINADYRS